MTPDDVKKIRADMRPGHHILTNDVVEAIDWLADALRASQAQTVQMREDAALTVEDCLRTGLLTPGNVKTAAAQVRRLPLPAPAARTYDDGVRDAAKIAHKAADGLRGRDCCTPERRFAREIEALLSPAPAVAPVASERTECASCSSAATHWDRFESGVKSGIAELCCGGPGCCEGGRTLGCVLSPLHPVAPVAAPKPVNPPGRGPGIARLRDEPAPEPFDAEAAIEAGCVLTAEWGSENAPVDVADLRMLLDTMLAAGRGAR